MNIEVLREELYSLLIDNKPTDLSVVVCSQKLDRLLVLYEKSNRNIVNMRANKNKAIFIKEIYKYNFKTSSI
jgi:Spo0E like sporulation regulatory protein.